jgi:Ca-activated chloride channel homolog
MTFVWPWALLSVLALPLLVAWYRRVLRRRTLRRAELAALGLVAPGTSASGRLPGRGRHLAPVLFLTALGLLFVALARPQATVAEPRQEGTVILAFDVSGSMAATDVTPTRLAAAQAAARGFVQRQPASVQLGVVAFGTNGLVTQRPTSDKAAVLAAIDRLTPLGGTALNRGLQASLSAILGKPVQVSDPNASPGPGASAAPGGSGSVEAQGQDLGYHGSAAVILLSDGEDTSNGDPLLAAQLASGAGVKGSPAGTVVRIDGFQVATKLDEVTLKQIAATTDGTYFAAADSRQLASVYTSIHPTWTVRAGRIEVTALFAAAAGLLLLAGAGQSLARTGRVI